MSLGQELLDDVVGRFADDGARGDQDGQAAETVRPHLRAGKGRDRRDIPQAPRAAHYVLKDKFPARTAEVEFDLDIVGTRASCSMTKLAAALSAVAGDCARAASIAARSSQI